MEQDKMQTNFSLIAKNFGKLLSEYGMSQIEEGDKVFILNDLIYTFEMEQGKWKHVGLGYTLFGRAFILLALDGKLLTVSENSETGETEYLEISDEAVLRKSREFLMWRLNVLKEMQM